MKVSRLKAEYDRKVCCAVFNDALLIACNESHDMNDSIQAALLTARSSLSLWFI
jgi:hypothetical protein